MSADGFALRVHNLEKTFAIRRGIRRRDFVHAVRDVSFDVAPGRTLGLVGESGCGKSTIGRCITGHSEPTAGRVEIGGRDLRSLSERDRRRARRSVQLVFQDPYSSLDPKMTVGESIAEPLYLAGRTGRDVVREVERLLDRIGLQPSMRSRFPHEFSGGQRQRIAIARALAGDPAVMVLDEPVSALDVSVQAQIVGMLQDLQDELGLAYVFISHDLSVVRHLADDVAVMYLGRIVETGPTDRVFAEPRHPYTAALLSSVPVPDPSLRSQRERIVLQGEVPSPFAPPPGCSFHPRCARALASCAEATPALDSDPDSPAGATRAVACFVPLAGPPSRAIPETGSQLKEIFA